MRVEDFDEVTEMAAHAVTQGCPTRVATGRPCAGCLAAADRIRKLELRDLPNDVDSGEDPL